MSVFFDVGIQQNPTEGSINSGHNEYDGGDDIVISELAALVAPYLRVPFGHQGVISPFGGRPETSEEIEEYIAIRGIIEEIRAFQKELAQAPWNSDYFVETNYKYEKYLFDQLSEAVTTEKAYTFHNVGQIVIRHLFGSVAAAGAAMDTTRGQMDSNQKQVADIIRNGVGYDLVDKHNSWFVELCGQLLGHPFRQIYL